MRNSWRNAAAFASACFALFMCCVAVAQQGKESARSPVTGNYEGTAKNKAEEVIQLTLELTEKEGAMSGMIHSDHGEFSITGGKHEGNDVTLEFDAQGETGTITLKLSEDKLAGTWSAGDDGGPVEVKKAAAKEKSSGAQS